MLSAAPALEAVHELPEAAGEHPGVPPDLALRPLRGGDVEDAKAPPARILEFRRMGAAVFLNKADEGVFTARGFEGPPDRVRHQSVR